MSKSTVELCIKLFQLQALPVRKHRILERLNNYLVRPHFPEVNQALVTGLPFSISSGLQFELIIGVLIVIGIVRGLAGRKYTPLRVLRAPVLYVLFTLVAVFLTSIPNIYAQLMLLFLPIGIPVGLRFGRDVKFFTKNGLLYYKRSPFILLLWAGALIARVALELYSSQSILGIIVFNALLSFITGMLLGEAIHIFRTRKKTSNEETVVSTDSAGRV